jgi:predicted RNase H-like nuclease
MPAVAVLGVDGCRNGWIGALVGDDGIRWRWFPTAAEIVAEPADVTAIDIPMGLPPAGHKRACDDLARKRLKKAGSSVFPAPPRQLIDQPRMTHTQTLEWLRRADLGGISAQAHGIIAKVREVDAVLDRGMQERVIETHPELCFRTMAKKSTLASKKSARGMAQRIDALHGWLKRDVVALLLDVPEKVAVDDALDALACAWTATRYAEGKSETLGAEAETTGKTLLMRIVV